MEQAVEPEKYEEGNVRSMLAKDVAEPAQSALQSQVVLAPELDGSLSFCVDYRELNAMTIRDTYPLQRMEE